MVEIGSIRPTQLITNFGPGSLINLEHDCVMVLGLQFWPKDTEEKKYFKKIMHPFLAKQLKKNYFKMPITDKKGIGIPCISFPQWGVCPHCHKLQRHSSIGKTNKGFFCEFCKKPELPMYHSKFVQICDNGHIHEFPWDYWAHVEEIGGKIQRKICTRSNDQKQIFEFTTRKKGTSLSDYEVTCTYCGAKNSLGGATDRDKFARYGMKECFQGQPWLKNTDKQKCNAQPYGVQTRSSSVYYSSSVTALLIPKWLHDVDTLLDKNEGENQSLIRGLKNNGISYDVIVDMFKDAMFKELLKNYSKSDVIKRLELRFNPVDLDVSTEGESLEQEFDDFAEIEKRKIIGITPDIKVDIEPLDISNSSIKDFHVSSLKKFHRLVSITVLRGFTRGSPPDPFATEDEIKKKNPLKFINSPNTRDVETGELVPIDWLPGVETKGEGIYFSLDEDILQDWEKRSTVKERFDVIVESYADNMDAQGRSEKEGVLKRFQSPRYMLLHTLAHLLIREIAELAGYNESSLKERIYSSYGGKMRNGILIHTSSSSSEGSLGGLVRLGNVESFEEIFENAVLRSDSCSRDPICRETDPVYAKNKGLSSGSQLSGCSCYSCILLPETCCHNFNTLLDRWMLFDKDNGFFRKNLSQSR